MALLSAISFYGQQKVASKVEELVKAKTTFKKISPFTLSTNPDAQNIEKVVNNATYAKLNSAVALDVTTNKYNAIELSLPYNGTQVTVLLYRAEVAAKGFHVDTDKKQDVAYEAGAHYRGIIKGDSKSVASFNFFNNEVNGIISSQALNNLVVGKAVKDSNTSDYIIYSDVQLNILNESTCGVTDTQKLPEVHTEKGGMDTQSARCVTLYFEIDYNLYVLNGSNTTTTTNWMTSIFNNVQTLYDNDGITTALKSIYIWTENDPYEGDSSGDYLSQFAQLRPFFDGDLGQLVSVDPGGLGGVAISIGGICSTNKVSYSDVDFNYQNVPLFSWTVQVITHELGHLMGSPHTHGCYWNGDNTAIDGCGTQAGFIEGNCEQGPIPTPTIKGTIMSYCHLINGVGINFANGFGTQPAARILDHVESSLCLSTDCINTCINNVGNFVVASTLTSATISWTDADGGPWEVGYAASTSAVSNWQETTVASFTFNDLQPNTYYRFAIRPLCSEDIEVQSQLLIFATAADWCSGVTFTDSRGDNNYPNNQHMIRTIAPENPNQDIIVTFNNFNTEADYDFLYVYDGPSINSPLIGTYSGTTVPGMLTSTAADGSLTFEFISDSGQTAPGWNANVYCSVLGVKENTFANLEYYPNPAHNSVTISSPEGITNVSVYNVAGQLLLNKAVNTTTVDADIASFANGIYIFNVTNGTKEAHFRIVKQ